MTLSDYFNSQFTLLQNLDFMLRIMAACLCGACIGFERSKRFKEAGIRTHIIVCCASALIMIVSKYGFADLTSDAGEVFNGTRGADPARIAAQVVSGISFLGAGVIFKNGNTVKGLTTAAGIWATAAIGLALGGGMYVVGVFVTFLIALFQVVMHRFTVGADSFTTNRLRFTVYRDEEFEAQIRAQLDEWSAQILSSSITRREDGYVTYDLTLKMTRALSIDDIDALVQHCSAVKSAEGVAVV